MVIAARVIFLGTHIWWRPFGFAIRYSDSDSVLLLFSCVAVEIRAGLPIYWHCQTDGRKLSFEWWPLPFKK